jgi:hypothetical protein
MEAYQQTELDYEWLAKALKQGYKDVSCLRSEPALRSIREERDFELLIRSASSTQQTALMQTESDNELQKRSLMQKFDLRRQDIILHHTEKSPAPS